MMFANRVIHPKQSILARKKEKVRKLKYKEALQALKAYQNSKLRLLRMIDNVLTPSKSISNHCQVPHCGMSIRYEYVLQNKETAEIIIAGSTCVWELLEMSDAQVKDFEKIENTIKEFHKMIAWKRDNEDVYTKIMVLKEKAFNEYKEFWNEIQYTALCDYDTQYIRNLDIQKLEDERARKEAEKAKREAERKARLEAQMEINKNKLSVAYANNEAVSGETDDSYKAVIEHLDRLHVAYPTDAELNSLYTNSRISTLSRKQVYLVKKHVNKDYFNTTVATDSRKMALYEKCDDVVISRFKQAVESKELKMYSLDVLVVEKPGNQNSLISVINKYKKQFNELVGNNVHWNLFRLKYDIVLK